ncbi:hypothetical protein SLA2020_065520 [Shorea laevis]
MPATADDYGSQPSGFMDTYVANCPASHGPDQTPLQQPDVPSWTTVVITGIGSQVDPGSLGFHCRTRPPDESCYTEVVISKMLEMMQEGFQRMEDNMDTKIQRSVVAALAQSGICPQTNAPIVSPAGPDHNPLGKHGGTNAAAGSSGAPITQSSPHNEEVLTLP